ncbi:MAG TPA: cell wall-binding repeat-containing protein [Egibacteraceae bacterium]|nr:cell wall-binding repeat-containing protein [Egibacteraceae bacterium]
MRTSYRRVLAAAAAVTIMVSLGAWPAVAVEDEVVDPPADQPQPLEDPTDPLPAASPSSSPALELSSAGPAWTAPKVQLLAGDDRFATAAAVSREGWPDPVPAVVLASGQDYPDALAAAALAGVVGGPLLLTGQASLHPAAAEELERLTPETVYIVGGKKAVSAPVADAIEDLGAGVERIAGADRYETALKVAGAVVELGGDPSVVLLASGAGFADALSASSIAAGLLHPIMLLAEGTDPAELAEQLQALGAGKIIVVGGAAAVPDAPLSALEDYERIAGADRTATAAAVADRAREMGLDGTPALASAETFPDGLAGGAFAGAIRRGPVLLTGKAQLAPAVMEWVAADQPERIVQLGGAGAVGQLAACQLASGEARSWRCVEEELARQGYNAGAIDGKVDHQSPWAVFALQKVAGIKVTGKFGDAEWTALASAPTLPARHPELPGDHIEIDLARQLLLVYRGGDMAHAFHTSSGKPSTPTVRGIFTVYRKLDYRNASNMYKPIYFYKRYAIHGYPSVPLHPASAGCARMYDGDADMLWPMVSMGERVAVY